MPLRQKNYAKKHNFLMEIDGINDQVAWQKVGPLEQSEAVTELWEGGASTANKSLSGRKTHTNITCEAGYTDNTAVWDWVNENSIDPYRNITIYQRNRDDSEHSKWKVNNALVARFVAGEWDATTDDPNMQILELAHDGFEPA
jgi:phage tail-like protein